jgi:hypothetical protein
MANLSERTSDVGRMREQADKNRKGGADFFKFDKGDTLIYVHPPCRNGDEYEPTKGLPFIPIGVHYGVGGKAMCPSLDPEDNPIIAHPFIKKELKKAGKKLTGKCPIKAALEGEDLSDEEADAMKLKVQYVWGITPLGFKKSKKEGAKWLELDDGPVVLFCGPQLNDALIEIFEEHGEITDPRKAIRVVVTKADTGQVSYKAKAYKLDLKKPYVLPKADRASLLKALEGECDLFRVVANTIKPPSKVKELLGGDIEDEDDDEDDKPKKGKGAKSKGKAKPKDDDDDEEEDEEEDDDDSDLDDDDDEEEEKPKKGAKAAKGKKGKAKPADDDEDDDDSDEDEDDDSDDEDDDEEEKPKAKKKAGKSKPKDDDDEDDEDDSDEDDDDEDEEKPKKKASKKAAGKKGKSKDDDDDDDLDLGDLESELKDLDDEDDDEEEKPKKKKGSKKGKR